MITDPVGLSRGVEGPPGRSRLVSIEERRRLVAESLQVGNPANHARDLPETADPRQECQIELKVTDIRPYEHNPRRSTNAKFSEIKESIRAAGILNPLTVTRRPGEAHFIVESGGNSRLLAVQQLWMETAETKFEKLSVLFRPWRSERHVLIAHMVENEQRGDMTFWDRAHGVIAIKSRLEAEKGAGLSLRQLASELGALGLATNPTSLSHYIFVTEKLAALGEVVHELSPHDIKTIQPRLNALKRHVLSNSSMSEALLYESIIDPILRSAAAHHKSGAGFDAEKICEACEAAVACRPGQAGEKRRKSITTLNRPATEVTQSMSGAARCSSAAATESPPKGAPGAHRNPDAANGVDSRGVRSSTVAERSEHVVVDDDDTTCGDWPTIYEIAQRLAQQAGIDAHLYPDHSSPLGFSMIQPDAASDLTPGALRMWSLLSHLAGPPRATQNGAILSVEGVALESAGSSAPRHQFMIGDDSATLVDWLVEPNEPLAGGALTLLQRLRALRSQRSRSPGEKPVANSKEDD